MARLTSCVSTMCTSSLSDDPSGIPMEDFECNGWCYYLLDMIRQNEVGVDTQPYTETITKDSSTEDMSAVLKKMEVNHRGRLHRDPNPGSYLR